MIQEFTEYNKDWEELTAEQRKKAKEQLKDSGVWDSSLSAIPLPEKTEEELTRDPEPKDIDYEELEISLPPEVVDQLSEKLDSAVVIERETLESLLGNEEKTESKSTNDPAPRGRTKGKKKNNSDTLDQLKSYARSWEEGSENRKMLDNAVEEMSDKSFNSESEAEEYLEKYITDY